MAAGSGELDMQLQDYFDKLAPTWDEGVTQREAVRLGEIVRALEIKAGSYVLDIGSGTGVLLPFLAEAVGTEGRIIALDFSREMLLRARTKNSFSIAVCIQADVLAIPLQDNCVDLVLCNGVFPHFSDKVGAMKEISRVLRNDGRLVICHTMSREAINCLHRSIGGVVGKDFLPDEVELKGMAKRAGLAITSLEDNSRRYLVIGEKEA